MFGTASYQNSTLPSILPRQIRVLTLHGPNVKPERSTEDIAKYRITTIWNWTLQPLFELLEYRHKRSKVQRTTEAKMKTKRFDTGCYRTTDGAYEIRSIAYHTEGSSSEQGWHLLDLRSEGDGYCNTFPTKADAIQALKEAKLEGTY